MGKPKYNLIFLTLLIIIRPDHVMANELPVPEQNEEMQQDMILGLWINGVDQHQDAMLTVFEQMAHLMLDS